MPKCKADSDKAKRAFETLRDLYLYDLSFKGK